MNILSAQSGTLSLTANIVSAHVSNNSVALSDLSGMIANVYAALARLGAQVEPQPDQQTPAVSIRASIKPNYLVCLEDGRHFKMLKRHLMNGYGLTPDAYRAKWRLPADYPMVAPAYAEKRRNLALKIGLGRMNSTAQRASTARAGGAKKTRSPRT
ncbi:MucR family transcriptional regulator (plasmid) [Polymorphobacter sp. PAMC 29334]|uniref:MucR family transcriptional regulator n=1 Tax=Polymorphobacter sp. PAMC 29334 TaxID=2862331 RepID=UPI001C6806A2|nr:MucR family transcriptional regulator [Polymorphobacter sp. PAMC 29334]QYE33236.1 MucR family transcriptional regulator [Polymorphobacter sp. PAMC 29334]